MRKQETPNIGIIQSVSIPLELIDNNVGQIPGVQENPREMTEMEFKKLKKSLMRNPGFTALSELKVYQHEGRWITIGGNMRLQAMRELGWQEAVCKPIPPKTSPDDLNRYILLDNANFGKWDFDRLANEWDIEELANMCVEIPGLDDCPDTETKEDEGGGVEKRTFILAPEQVDDIKRILAIGKKKFKQKPGDPDNTNGNAKALTEILKDWITQQPSENAKEEIGDNTATEC